MAAQLAHHLSHKSALALLPHATITSPIELVRREHDKHFNRWPPHINLIYPFLASPSESQPTNSHMGEQNSPCLKQHIQQRIEKAVKTIPSFRTSLSADPPGVFSHGKRSKTVWLGPTSDRAGQLQAALQAEFSECDADTRPFVPHLSIGQAASDAGAQRLGETIRAQVLEFTKTQPVLDWDVDRVFVIERKGYHDRFRVVGAIELGEM
ncbi:hypothetical protein DM02DRAFT_644385 [Periconia macrospinosa]|uniref:LigT-like protein n=1 Tax=Periconia macrospinosa TaxID=97972 RepID=A0A2V1DFZ7_9PLEO|nr:hypothetical protein DM02DRAFT_644385 [Periconia macrospinosa]